MFLFPHACYVRCKKHACYVRCKKAARRAMSGFVGHEFYSQPSNSLPARSDQLDGKALALMVNSTVVLMMPILYKLLTCYSDTYPQIFVPYLCKSNSCGHIFTKIEPCPQGAKRRDC